MAYLPSPVLMTKDGATRLVDEVTTFVELKAGGWIVVGDVPGARDLAVHQSELDAAMSTVLGEAGALLTAHENDGEDAHDASAISYAPSGPLTGLTVQDALDELAAGGGEANDPAALHFRGLWQNTTTYAARDAVIRGDALCIALAPSTNVDPATEVPTHDAPTISIVDDGISAALTGQGAGRTVGFNFRPSADTTIGSITLTAVRSSGGAGSPCHFTVTLASSTGTKPSEIVALASASAQTSSGMYA